MTICKTERIRLADYCDYTNDDKVHDILKWYDRHLRLWRIWAVNANGDQIGESQYACGKELMQQIFDDMKCEYGLD